MWMSSCSTIRKLFHLVSNKFKVIDYVGVVVQHDNRKLIHLVFRKIIEFLLSVSVPPYRSLNMIVLMAIIPIRLH